MGIHWQVWDDRHRKIPIPLCILLDCHNNYDSSILDGKRDRSNPSESVSLSSHWGHMHRDSSGVLLQRSRKNPSQRSLFSIFTLSHNHSPAFDGLLPRETNRKSRTRNTLGNHGWFSFKPIRANHTLMLGKKCTEGLKGHENTQVVSWRV